MYTEDPTTLPMESLLTPAAGFLVQFEPGHRQAMRQTQIKDLRVPFGTSARPR